MNEPAPPPRRTPPAGDDRDRRLKAALRANLARRKAQARGRAAGAEAATAEDEPATEPRQDKD